MTVSESLFMTYLFLQFISRDLVINLIISFNLELVVNMNNDLAFTPCMPIPVPKNLSGFLNLNVLLGCFTNRCR